MRHLLFLQGTVLIAALSITSSAESQGKKKTKAPIWSENKDAFGDFLPIGAVARIGTVRYRVPEGQATSGTVVSPDGKLLAVAGVNNDIDVWELPGWIKRRTIRGRTLNLNSSLSPSSLAFTADSKRLLAFDSAQAQVHFVDLDTGKSVRTLNFPKGRGNRDPQFHLARDQKTLVCATFNDGGKNQTLEYLVWDLAKDKLLHTFEAPFNRFAGMPPRPALSADARWLAQLGGQENQNARAGYDSHIEIWDVFAGKSKLKIETDSQLRTLALSPDGKWLATTDGTSNLRVYDATSGKEIHNVRLRRSAISHLQFAPDGKSLYVAEFDGTISQWDPLKAERTALYPSDVFSGAQQLVFLEGGGMRALGFGIEAIHYWDVKTGKALSPTNVPEGFIDHLSFAPGGELFVAAEDGHAAWWNPRTGAKVRDLKLEYPNEGLGGATKYSIYSIGPRDIVDYAGPRPSGGMLTMARNAEFVASGNGIGLTFYDAKTGKLLYDDGSPNGNPSTFAFFDGGRKAASIQQKKVRLWNTRTGRDIAKFDVPLRNQEQAFKLSVSASGRYLAVATTSLNGDNNQARTILWDTETKKLVREWQAPGRQDHMQFSPDARWFAAAGATGSVRLARVDHPRGDLTLSLGGASDEITEIAFSPDGRQLAAAIIVAGRSRDTSRIHVFEMASRKVRLELVGHANGIIDRLTFAHDSGLLASGASDTTALVWKAGLHAFTEKRADKDASADELTAWFDQLAQTNAKAAFQHMIKLAQTPAQTVKHFEDKIAPAAKPETGEKTIPQWIRDLGSASFVVRTKANTALLKLAIAAESELTAALPNAQDVETKRRIEELLDRIALNEWSPEEVRQARAVEVLEAIGTPAARALLTRWTTGDPDAVLTKQARQALAPRQ